MASHLLRHLRHDFSPAERERGTELWLDEAVALANVTETEAEAEVQADGLDYHVRCTGFDIPGAATYRCSCRPLSVHVACAHAYAMVMALDQLLVGMEASLSQVHGEREASARPPAARTAPPSWRRRLGFLAAGAPATATSPLPAPTLEYYLELRRHDEQGFLRVHVRERVIKKNGERGVPRCGRLPEATIEQLPRLDRTLVQLARRARQSKYHGLSGSWRFPDFSSQMPWDVALVDVPAVLPHLAATGRAYLAPVPAAGETPRPVVVDTDVPFEFELRADEPAKAGQPTVVQGVCVRGGQSLQCTGMLLRDTDYLLVEDRLVRVECHGAHAIASELALRGPLQVPAAEAPQLLGTLARAPGAGRFLVRLLDKLPSQPPTGVLQLTFPRLPDAPLPAQLKYDYDGVLVDAAGTDVAPVVVGADVVRRRDVAAEGALHAQVLAAGVVPDIAGSLACPRERLVAVVAMLGRAGFRVLAEGKPVRPFVRASGSVRSGIDWFEVGGAFAFDGREVPLPELLRRKSVCEGFVELDDGSFGMLPATWLRQVEALRLLGGEIEDDVLRVPDSQALLLDALLAAREENEFTVDARFAAMRKRLAAFTAVVPAHEPGAFRGELRPYQRQGLGWLEFLREFGLGGCLADDMGLGKTVQVLALLVSVHGTASGKPGRGKPPRRGLKPRPSLLVAPRSVLGNWLAEIARFAPGLRVVDFSGPERWRDGTDTRLADADLVLTTYALVRADAVAFAERELRFHYAILDEAQAVKNPDSQNAKAVRLLQALHRLVLTGTPVENHLGDLWSLFEFLNPGMLGRLPAFRALFGRDASDEAMAQHRSLVQRALRPVLLRRTKAQVLTDLPEKVEQTLWCEMAPVQRRRYDQLKEHYRQRLLAGPGELDDTQRFVVLEALLRLRQVACHEGLLDPRAVLAESAKFEELLPRLEELAAEGHKALVFSQFTSLLDLLEAQLRRRGMTWERLDGKTKRRAERVERFQTDAKCPLFLISLKAGGYGLNLTAAGYVFLLDPWWNPAVEMQAIDRAHRIGQKRTVNAYRLVCRGTVEERVLELQGRKKALCEAILGNERSLLQDLTRADLELLLG